jgi:hypothetical protein
VSPAVIVLSIPNSLEIDRGRNSKVSTARILLKSVCGAFGGGHVHILECLDLV